MLKNILLLAVILAGSKISYAQVNSSKAKHQDTMQLCNGTLNLAEFNFFNEVEYCQLRKVYPSQNQLNIMVEPIIIDSNGIGIFSFLCYSNPVEISFSKKYLVLRSDDIIFINNESTDKNIQNVALFIKNYSSEFNSSQREAIYNLFTQ